MRTNVGAIERIGSAAAGMALLYFGSRRSRMWRFAEAAGTGLLVRGVMGYCPVNALLGRDLSSKDTRAALAGPRGIHILESVIVPGPPEAAYAFWRDLANLPRFMSHLQRVDVVDSTHSHWVAAAPAGMQVEWDAKIINDVEGRLIGWKSLEHADVVNAGSVRFRPTGGGTEITVHLQYDPPGGKLGHWIAEAFGESPSQTIRQDLRRLKLQFGGGVEPDTSEAGPVVRQEGSDRVGRTIGRSWRSPHSFQDPV
jgi:uncharacterized membrane protein